MIGQAVAKEGRRFGADQPQCLAAQPSVAAWAAGTFCTERCALSGDRFLLDGQQSGLAISDVQPDFINFFEHFS